MHAVVGVCVVIAVIGSLLWFNCTISLFDTPYLIVLWQLLFGLVYDMFRMRLSHGATGFTFSLVAYIGDVRQQATEGMKWIVDSGCGVTMTPERMLLTHTKQASRGARVNVTVASGKATPSAHTGMLEFLPSQHVPGLGAGIHLLSVAQMTDFGLICMFLSTHALVFIGDAVDPTATFSDLLDGNAFEFTTDFLRVEREGNLYKIPHDVLTRSLRRLHRERQQHAALGCPCGGISDESAEHHAFSVGTSAPVNGVDLYKYWHARFHVSDTVLYEMAKKKLVPVPLSEFAKPHPRCLACSQARVTRKRHARRRSRSSETGQLISADIMYLTNMPSRGGARYALLLVDDFSGKWWVMNLKDRAHVPAAVKLWFDRYVRPSGVRLQRFRTDRAGEFESAQFSEVMDAMGVHHEFSNAEEHAENGLAERAIRSLEEMIRVSLIDSSMDVTWWAEAAQHAVVHHNATPSQSRRWKSPNDLWGGIISPWDDVTRLRRFGTPAVALRTARERGNNAKVHATGAAVRVIGYDLHSMAYRCLGEDGKIRLRSSVYADESSMLESPDGQQVVHRFTSPLLQSFVKLDTGVTMMDDRYDFVHKDVPVFEEQIAPPVAPLMVARATDQGVGEVRVGDSDLERTSSTASNPVFSLNHGVGEQQAGEVPVRDGGNGTQQTAPAPELRRSERSTRGQAPARLIESMYTDLYVECALDGCRLSSMRGRDDHEVFAAFSAMVMNDTSDFVPAVVRAYLATADVRIPRNPEEAVSGKTGVYFEEAMQLEWTAMKENGVFKYAIPRPGERVLPSHWIFSVKGDQFGQVVRFKARWVANGSRQPRGLEEDIYAPVVRQSSLYYVLSLAAIHDLELLHADVPNAFTRSPLKPGAPRVLVRLPPKVDVKDAPPGAVAELLMSLYGTREAPHNFNVFLTEHLTALGFTRCEADQSVYFRRDGDRVMYICTHVDDLIIAHNSDSMCEEVISYLKREVALTVKPLEYFLGMAVVRDRVARTLTLSQAQYVRDILLRFGMDQARPESTPADSNVVLSKEMSPTTEAERQVMQALPMLELGGSLLFLARYTRPDIAYAVNDVLRYGSDPGPLHWKAMKRICRYLVGTTELGVTLGGLQPVGRAVGRDLKGEFYVYADADHGRNPDTRRSTTGHVFYVNGGPIAWHVRYQRSVAKSSTIAEYFSVDDAAQDVLQLRMLVDELGSPPSAPTLIFEDNQPALRLMAGAVPSDATRHIAIRHFLIRDSVEQGSIKLEYCPTDVMVADVLTKPLPRVSFQSLRPLLMGDYARHGQPAA